MTLFGKPTVTDDDDESEKPATSPLLQMSSAWSVWPTLIQNVALKPLAENVKLSAAMLYPQDGAAVIGDDGVIYANPRRIAPAAEWLFMLAHLLAHLGLRHLLTEDRMRQAADERAANALVRRLHIGQAPDRFLTPPPGDYDSNADALYKDYKAGRLQVPSSWNTTAGVDVPDVIRTEQPAPSADQWAMLLTQGLLAQVGVDHGHSGHYYASWATIELSKARGALWWFADHYPLLSALASHFRITENRETIAAHNIQIAAVVAERMEIFVNPDAKLTTPEMRFVIAHEMLHVGLLHHSREGKRDHFLWNVACDFVINAWLTELGVGEMPRGGLYNPGFAGLSANEIYNRLLQDAEYVRTLATFRGAGLGDILPPGSVPGRRANAPALDDNEIEELMKQGMEAHVNGGRGLIPAGLLETITATISAPPAWRLALGRWFDARFNPSAPSRTYARPSRRQQATPDIPRPRYAPSHLPDGAGLFGVLLDTSGSMNAQLLSRGLGAIVALARKYQINQVRLMYCDAEPHDEGFVSVERLAGPIPVHGRGGTRLQNGIDALLAATDFPADAPILVITDGDCDKLTIPRDHAFLLPEGKRLPFAPVGPVFRLA